jgi:hypothetical protein
MAKARRQTQARNAQTRYDRQLCAGHLLVWTWRKLVAGEVECPVLAREYMSFADGRGLSLLEAFSVFLQALGAGSRRMLAVGQPYCAGITNDEALMLRLVAAAQARDEALLTAHLSWMVRASGHEAAQLSVLHLADTLLDCGVVLPPVTPAAPPAGPAMLTVCR